MESLTLDLQQVAAAIGAGATAETHAVSGWSVDTRTLARGDLFFALRGPNHDGHAYVATAFERGAAGAVVERPAGGVVLQVPDTQVALESLAAFARKHWGGEVVAVTGSAGKTTTKDVIAHLLAGELRIGKTEGNFNNHVGLPLSILRLPAEARVAVLEIGMNHSGEIRHLAGIARPDIAVVTNVGWAHAENFDSIEGVALAKRELVEALSPSGAAVLNADDARVSQFREVHSGRCMTFGLSEAADVRAEDVEYTSDGVRFRVGECRFETPLAGRHGVLNILAGVAVAHLYGIAPERLIERARTLAPGKMRGERFTHAGATVFNDCYNSNPDAARLMLDLLRDTPARRRIAVLGEMLELGRWAEPLHRDVGIHAANSGLSVLIGIRGAASHLVDAAQEAGFPASAAYFFEDPVSAGDLLRQIAREGDVILFKGSRGTRVERALERFLT